MSKIITYTNFVFGKGFFSHVTVGPAGMDRVKETKRLSTPKCAFKSFRPPNELNSEGESFFPLLPRRRRRRTQICNTTALAVTIARHRHRSINWVYFLLLLLNNITVHNNTHKQCHIKRRMRARVFSINGH